MHPESVQECHLLELSLVCYRLLHIHLLYSMVLTLKIPATRQYSSAGSRLLVCVQEQVCNTRKAGSRVDSLQKIFRRYFTEYMFQDCALHVLNEMYTRLDKSSDPVKLRTSSLITGLP